MNLRLPPLPVSANAATKSMSRRIAKMASSFAQGTRVTANLTSVPAGRMIAAFTSCYARSDSTGITSAPTHRKGPATPAAPRRPRWFPTPAVRVRRPVQRYQLRATSQARNAARAINEPARHNHQRHWSCPSGQRPGAPPPPATRPIGSRCRLAGAASASNHRHLGIQVIAHPLARNAAGCGALAHLLHRRIAHHVAPPPDRDDQVTRARRHQFLA